MQFSLQTGFSVAVIGSPLDINGNPSNAVLSSQVYTSSDPTVFTVAPDPNTPGGAIITSVGSGLNAGATPPVAVVSGTLTESATATELNGVTESIQGVATIAVTAAPPPPPPVAASIGFTFGTPFATPPPAATT